MSPTTDNLAGVLNTAIGALPSILALIKSARAKDTPGAPAMTDADALAALAYAVASTVAKDEAWKLAHPVERDAKPPVPANTTGD